jgi:hypothetical protein
MAVDRGSSCVAAAMELWIAVKAGNADASIPVKSGTGGM